MKKILIIVIGLMLLALAGIVLFRSPETPVVEKVRDILPFGEAVDLNIPTANNRQPTIGEETPFDENITIEDKVFRISSVPVAGFVALQDEGDLSVRYIERATGHIFDAMLPKGGVGLEKIRVTNTTIPKIYEAYFHSNGSQVLTRSINESGVVENTVLNLVSSSVTSTNLRGNIDSVLPSSGNTIFYVLKDSDAIVSSSWTGTNLRTLFQSDFDSWRLGRYGNNLLVHTKASAYAPGYVYTVNSSGGALNKLLGPLNGLMAVANSNASRLLYSYYQGGVTKLFARNSSGESLEILPATLAEKCVWSREEPSAFFCGTPREEIEGLEPDGWYQGRTHFSDYVWRFDTASEIAQLVSEPKTDFGLDLDIYQPSIAGEDEYLIFINKQDLTLWAIKLEE